MSVTTVYVAASSRDLARAKRWTRALLDCNIGVSSTWIESVESVGEANPRNASSASRRRMAERCITGIAESDILWLLVPSAPLVSAGAWCEFGFAWMTNRVVIASGDTKLSVFSALALEFETDAAAFSEILARDARSALEIEQGPSG